MNRRATARIVADSREEFAELREKLSLYIEPNADVNQVRLLLVEHAPTMVIAKTQLLLDTLLNYLMEDATEALTNAPTTVKNEFYNLDLRSCVKESFTMEPESLEFSFDPRVIAGGVVASATVATGGLITALFLSELISRIVGGVATLVASAVAFRIAHTATTGTALQRLQKDMNDYLAHSEQQVSSWLESIEKYFVEAFKEFQDGRDDQTEERPDGSGPSGSTS